MNVTRSVLSIQYTKSSCHTKTTVANYVLHLLGERLDHPSPRSNKRNHCRNEGKLYIPYVASSREGNIDWLDYWSLGEGDPFFTLRTRPFRHGCRWRVKKGLPGGRKSGQSNWRNEQASSKEFANTHRSVRRGGKESKGK